VVGASQGLAQGWPGVISAGSADLLMFVPTCLCLPVVPTCLCLPVCICNSGERSARSKALLDLIAINCIDSNRSLWAFAGCTFKR